MLKDLIEKEIRGLKEKGIYRTLSTVLNGQEPRVKINGRDCILLCSNNYLGLANHPKVKDAAIKAIEEYGVGSGASRLVSGNMKPHKELEERIARFKGTKDAILFNSGYHANIGVISAIVGRGDFIFSDKLNHASIVDGCILSGAEFKRYPHRDLNILERFLKQSLRLTAHALRLIVTDGVFSMDGDIAPLPDILKLARKYRAVLMVDDAHATGVLGKNGRGTLEHFDINDTGIIQMGTLGKAVGSFGAYIAGAEKLIEYLVNKARPFIYTTSLPPAVCAASIAAIDIIENEPEIRQNLWEKVRYFRNGLKDAGVNIISEDSHIISVLIGDASKAKVISEKLFEKGVFIQAIRPPTVHEGTSRLRITVMANHEWDDLKYALDVVKDVVNCCD